MEARWILADARDDAIALARRRAAGEPLQYVTGSASFRGVDLQVGPGVFVPRPETELVAAKAMDLLPKGGTVVDVGTGSGAIALSIADERPDARVYATELSDEALVWAARNVGDLGLPVELIRGDLLAGLPTPLRGRIDVVVSNPPYISFRDRTTLPPDVVDHEPHMALFSPQDGLGMIRTLAEQARSWLRRDGWVVCEIGERQGESVKALLQELGFERVSIERDLADKDRIACATIP